MIAETLRAFENVRLARTRTLRDQTSLFQLPNPSFDDLRETLEQRRTIFYFKIGGDGPRASKAISVRGKSQPKPTEKTCGCSTLTANSTTMSPLRPVELVIFDLDGTLIHSAPDIVMTTNELMRRRGREKLAESIIIDAIGEGLMQLVFDCFPEARGDQAQLDAIAAEFGNVYEENLLKLTKIFQGIESFLEETETAGTQKVAIVTNKRAKWTETTMQGLKLDRFNWVRVYGADSLSERKPHPLPLIEAMKAAGVKPENTVMVGDGLPDMKAAVRAGVHGIGCAYGYCSAEKLIAAGASFVIQSPHDLREALHHVATLAPRSPLA